MDHLITSLGLLVVPIPQDDNHWHKGEKGGLGGGGGRFLGDVKEDGSRDDVSRISMIL